MKILSVFLIPFLFSIFLKGEQPDVIIGKDDRVVIAPDKSNVPFRFRKLISAIGFLDIGCTVTHIGGGYGVTAGHCLWGAFSQIPVIPKINQPCLDDFGLEYKILWGYRGEEGAIPESKSVCEKIVFAQVTPQIDFAILKFKDYPKQKIDLEISEVPQLGQRITIFSHADSLPLQWSKVCEIRNVIHSDKNLRSLMHQCDTNPGSSGAAILDLASLKIIGLHNGGSHYLKQDFENSEDLVAEEVDGLNYGTYVMDRAVLDVLKGLGFK